MATGSASSADRSGDRYGSVAVAIHWVTALLVLTQIYIGFTFSSMARGPESGAWFTWHKTLGVVILILALVRLGWRLTHRPPPLPPEMPGWERAAATWSHRAFYFLLLALPLTGLAAISAGYREPLTALLAGIPFPTIPGIPATAGEALGGLHGTLVLITLALLLLHVAAALRHQFAGPVRLAGRMPPFGRREDAGRGRLDRREVG